MGDPHTVVLDLRSAAEHQASHIPGAVSASYEGGAWRVKQADGAGGALPPVPQIAATLAGFGVGDADRAVIVSDDFGAAARAYWTLRVLGHDEVSILDGGWRGWERASLPLETGPVMPQGRDLHAALQPGASGRDQRVEQAVRSGGETLVDARPPAQWEGRAKTSAVAAVGHLPRAVWVDQSTALSSDGHLKSRPELERVFAALGRDKPATTYCNTGHLAATDWFVLSEVLGRPGTKLYDGSMSQWTADPSRPVER